jgi:hypothetical protein
MSIPGSAHPLLLSSLEEEGYFIERSLRFESSDSAYLSKSFGSAATDLRKQSISFWVKLSAIEGKNIFTGWNTTSSFETMLVTTSTNQVLIRHGGSSQVACTTNAVFRDLSAWYHFLLVFDTTEGTSSERTRFYVNGIRQTFASATYPSTNANSQFGLNSGNQYIGTNFNATSFFNGYLADIHFIDGQALDPSSFGEFDATTGVWVPIEYTGSYGTNGFHLDFSDNSAATATTLGKDRAGSNNWTPNNLSVTAGAGNDSLVDVPTNGAETDTGAGGEVRGNYATLNPLDNGGITLTNGNLDWARPSAGTRVCYSTIGVSSGKWYFESSIVGATGGVNWECGVATTSASNAARPGTTATGWQALTSGSTTIIKQNNNTTTTIFTGTIASGDIFSVALDMDNGRIWFGRNGTWLEGNPAAGTGASFTNLSGTVEAFAGGDGSVSGSINFGQRAFAYTAPSGFKALNTANLPAPLVTKPSTVFDTTLYTGNNTARSITGLGFSPDFVWIKGRSGATDHALYDIVRGAQADLVSNSTAAETTQSTGLTAFNSDGFSIGTLAKLNTNSATYAGWCWDAGSSTVTNTVGSISSQVRANATAVFSIVTYTGNGSAGATIGHGLGVAPHFVIARNRDSAQNWQVYHKNLTSAAYYLMLNSTLGESNNVAVWNNTAPSATVVTLGAPSAGGLNVSGQKAVAYCFAPVAGYSSFGSYTGNGSTDGPFVYLGFRPALVIVKMSSSTGNWTMLDTKREGYNVDNDPLFPNLSNAEGTTDLIDITSNGFKVRTTDATFNTNAGTYVYAAWAESPFQYSRAR